MKRPRKPLSTPEKRTRLSRGFKEEPRGCIIGRKRADGTPYFQAIIRQGKGERVHLGPSDTREGAEAMIAAFIEHGIRPAPGVRGPKKGQKQNRRTEARQRPATARSATPRVTTAAKPSTPTPAPRCNADRIAELKRIWERTA